MANELSDYEQLSQSLQESAGSLDYLIPAVQAGIEIEVFAKTPAGQVILGEAYRVCKISLSHILSATTDDVALSKAVMELRVQHRLIHTIASAIKDGRKAELTINRQDNEDPLR